MSCNSASMKIIFSVEHITISAAIVSNKDDLSIHKRLLRSVINKRNRELSTCFKRTQFI